MKFRYSYVTQRQLALPERSQSPGECSSFSSSKIQCFPASKIVLTKSTTKSQHLSDYKCSILFQDEKNQIMTTSVWLRQVRLPLIRTQTILTDSKITHTLFAGLNLTQNIS